MALHDCKQRHDWLYYNNIYKSSLLNISKICMDLSVASSLHGNKITADKDLEKNLSEGTFLYGKRREITKSLKSETLRVLVCMLVLVTTEITKIHGIPLYKDGVAYNKTDVELMHIRCTHQ